MTEPKRRANDLDGKTWTRHSISVWSDLKKTPAEMALGHPASFPVALPLRLIDCFTTAADSTVLDPFVGSGSTVLAAALRGKTGVGLDLSDEYLEKARRRLEEAELPPDTPAPRLLRADARQVAEHVAPESVHFAVTSPPYWDILLARRTADYKPVRHYGDAETDLGKIAEYPLFLESLRPVFEGVLQALAPGKYCCVVVMDLRKKDQFFPFHSDLAALMQEIGFKYDDLIIWDRRLEYNSFRPLGYPAVFRVNKAHEFILIFQKPAPARIHAKE